MTARGKFLQSKSFSAALWLLGGLVVILVTFKAGVSVGYRKARFSFQWGESYHRNFAGPRGGFFRDFYDRDFIEAHGTFGRMLTIERTTSTPAEAVVILQGRDGVEKIVQVDAATTIRRGRGVVPVSALDADDFIVVIGEPNETGRIAAKFIRVMPPPPSGKRGPDVPFHPRWR